MDQKFKFRCGRRVFLEKEKVPNLSPIRGQEASAGIIRRGIPCSFSVSGDFPFPNFAGGVWNSENWQEHKKRPPKALNPAYTNQNKKPNYTWAELSQKLLFTCKLEIGISPHILGKRECPWVALFFSQQGGFYGFKRFAALTAQLLIWE